MGPQLGAATSTTPRQQKATKSRMTRGVATEPVNVLSKVAVRRETLQVSTMIKERRCHIFADDVSDDDGKSSCPNNCVWIVVSNSLKRNKGSKILPRQLNWS